jgi:hypothetical protein
MKCHIVTFCPVLGLNYHFLGVCKIPPHSVEMSLGKNVSWTKRWNVRVKTSPGHSKGGRTVRALKEDDRLEEVDTIHGGIVVSSSDSTSVDIKSLREEVDDDIPTMSQGPVILEGMVKIWFICSN